MSQIPANWINAVPNDVVIRCTNELNAANTLRIAAIAAQTRGLHLLLNELNAIKATETWLDMMITLATNDETRKIVITLRERLTAFIEERYSDLALYELVVLFVDSTRKDGRKTIYRTLTRELIAFRMAGIELDPDGKQTLQKTLAHIRKLENSQIAAIDSSICAEGKSTTVTTDTSSAYKEHYMSFISNIRKEPLSRLITLRHALAEMLDYESYASMVQVRTLARQPEAVAYVLAQITPEYDYSFSDEARALLTLNKNKPIHAWDLGSLQHALTQRYAPMVMPFFSRDSVFALTIKLTDDIGITLKPGTKSWNANVQHWSCINGDIYIEQTDSAKSWQLIPITHRLTTYGVDMEIVSSIAPNILVRGPNSPFTIESLESFLMQWGRALRYLVIGSGVAGLLDAEIEAADITGHILTEMMWEERNMQNLEAPLTAKDTRRRKIPVEKLRYLRRRRDLLVGLQSKIEMLHCKFDLIVHSNTTFLKTIRACKTEEEAASELQELQTRLWKDNMGCANQSKFAIVPSPVFEAPCWKELYETPALRYNEIWGKLLAADVYQNCILAGNGKAYADKILRYGAMARTDSLINKLLNRYPNYDAYFDLRVHMLRSYYDRDDDEASEQVKPTIKK